MVRLSSADIRQPHVPNVFVILFCLIVLVAALSLVIPSGAYERTGERVVPDTFSHDRDVSEDARPSRPRWAGLVFAVFKAPLYGLVDAAPIVAFILLIGGAFRVMDETKAVSAALSASIRILGHIEYAILPMSMLLFSLAGATIGINEEIIPFVLLFLPLARMLGYHPVVGVAVPLVGSQIGLATAIVNPATLEIAQGIAGVPTSSGWQFRTVIWLGATAVAIVFVMMQSKRWEYDKETLDPDIAIAPNRKTKLSSRQVLVLLTLGFGLVLILWGVRQERWGELEIGAVFVAVGVIAGLIARMSTSAIARRFVKGAGDLLSAALVVGVARGIVWLARETRILDTIVFYTADVLGALAGSVAVHGMFLFHSVLNFFIPSGSGQAALTLPIFMPLADSVGLTQQMAVLAFQLGDGFTNMIVPTSAVLMASLEAGRVSFQRWFAFSWLLQLWLLAFGFLTLALAVFMSF